MPGRTWLNTFTLSLLLLAAACKGGGSSSSSRQPQDPPSSSGATTAIAAAARPIAGTADDYSDIVAAARDATRVLLGESTHGTHEYYRERGRISERLIQEAGINSIAIEGDWSPTFRVNLYVRGLGSDRTATEALAGFKRFPLWMWGNAEFRDFVERLRTYNLARPAEQRVGLYGMDVYDLYEAADATIAYLREADPAAAARAEQQYRCFAAYNRSNAEYGAATRIGNSCREQAEAVVAEVARLPRPADPVRAELHFGAVRAAASVRAAEEYFRIAYSGTNSSWNARDQRMAENVDAIAAHVGALTARQGKVVVWSHNSHSGDARATSAAGIGELNLGQLMRQRHGAAAFLVGFFSYRGQVMAAPEWDNPGRIYEMRPALPGSHSALFHSLGRDNFSLLMRGNEAVSQALAGAMLQRAIGVVYLPETERQSHYFEARLSEQFDAAIFFDQSKAVTPISR